MTRAAVAAVVTCALFALVFAAGMLLAVPR